MTLLDLLSLYSYDRSLAMGDEPKTIEELLQAQEQWQKEVGKTFYSIRTSASLSQVAFSNAIGLSQSYVSEIEHGSKAPSAETFTKLLNFIEGSTDGTPL